ncbi:hypothetical protein FRC09_008153 [Ceratobasidium sp. 395]|nr:hypothetical protein FRC09_008153 [Ceratobasidium sp. 395]
MSRAGVEVRFEWVRGRKRRRAGRGEASEPAPAAVDPSRTVGTGRRIQGGGGGGDGLESSAVGNESLSAPGPIAGCAPSAIASEQSTSPDARRRSIDNHPRSRRGSKRSMLPMKKGGGAMARNNSGLSRGRKREEYEEDMSDPEDSETPWSCTLHVLPLELPPPPSSNDLATPTTVPTDPSLPIGLKLRLAHLVPAQ